MYHYMKSKEDIVGVLINYKCLHLCTYISNLKLLDDISSDFDQEYWFLCLHYWRGSNTFRHNEPLIEETLMKLHRVKSSHFRKQK